jgi:hypothetical protein
LTVAGNPSGFCAKKLDRLKKLKKTSGLSVSASPKKKLFDICSTNARTPPQVFSAFQIFIPSTV